MAEIPIGRVTRNLATRTPEAALLTDAERTVTCAEFELRTNRLARAYAKLGVTENSLVTIGLPNGIEFYEACHAVWKLGATPQPVSSKLPQAEREAIVELADSALIVGSQAGAGIDRPTVPPGYEPDAGLGDAPLPEKVARYWRAPTSGGSTGRPKIILSNVPATTDPEAKTMRVRPGGAMLVVAPLYHGGPFLSSMLGLWRGKHVVVRPRFDAQETLAFIDRYAVDWIMLVPTMMNRIWHLPETTRTRYDLATLDTVLHMGASCPQWLKQSWIEWLGGDRIYELYAGTEAQGMTWISGTEWMAHKGSVGRPIRGCEMRVLGEDGAELPRGEIGEIFIRQVNPSVVTYKYIGATAIQVDGWETLGDMGWMDDDGYVYIADRRADMIVTGGANVYPAEVEAALDEHPAVLSSAVVGLPDDDLGHAVHGIYHADEPIDEEELRAHLASRLVRYKIPRTFEFVAHDFRDEGGKVRRRALRDARITVGKTRS